MTQAEWEELLLLAKRLEDCVFEGIPPHSGYRKAARVAAKQLISKITVEIYKAGEGIKG